jgi:hypothetical protein
VGLVIALFFVLVLSVSGYAAGRLSGYRFGYRQGYLDGDEANWPRRHAGTVYDTGHRRRS